MEGDVAVNSTRSGRTGKSSTITPRIRVRRGQQGHDLDWSGSNAADGFLNGLMSSICEGENKKSVRQGRPFGTTRDVEARTVDRIAGLEIGRRQRL